MQPGEEKHLGWGGQANFTEALRNDTLGKGLFLVILIWAKLTTGDGKEAFLTQHNGHISNSYFCSTLKWATLSALCFLKDKGQGKLANDVLVRSTVV